MNDLEFTPLEQTGASSHENPPNVTATIRQIKNAQRLLRDHDIEIWSGPRLVKLLIAKKPRKAVSHTIKDGCMVPKK
jgi:hypothetical protein